MKFSEFQETLDNCSVFGFYIYNTPCAFSKTIVNSIHRGITPTKKFEDGGTSIFARGDKANIDVYRTKFFLCWTNRNTCITNCQKTISWLCTAYQD
jgi:hypothetical protein